MHARREAAARRADAPRPRAPDDRLRAPLRHLQARRARLHRPRAPARAAGAARRRRQGAPAGQPRQGRDAADRRARARALRPHRLPRGLRHRARADDHPRLRRLAEQPDPPARGVRHLGHEGRRQRRPQPLGARRLVAGGLRPRGRLGDRRRLRRGRPEQLYRLLESEVVPTWHDRDRWVRDDDRVDRTPRAAVLDAARRDRVRRELLLARLPRSDPGELGSRTRPGRSPSLHGRRGVDAAPRTHSARGVRGGAAEHRTVLRRAFAAHGGVEVDTQGDAFFVAFPTAPGALAAAAAAQRALEAGPIRVRMGIHTARRSSPTRATSASTFTAPRASPPAATAARCSSRRRRPGSSAPTACATSASTG